MHPTKRQLTRLIRPGRAVPSWLRTVVVSVALLVLLLVPRLAELDALVTPDETLWIGRSANFYEALKSGDFADTYQFVHPGVPVMWLGAFGYVLHIRAMPYLMGDQQLGVRQREVQDVLEANGYPVLDVLVELRQVVIVASALVVIALFLCLTRLVPFWFAATAVAFLALDPMHIGFTRLLHLDGISANFTLLAIVAYAWYLSARSRTALVVTAVATGLACLTRSANAVLLPFFGVMAAFDFYVAIRTTRSDWRQELRARLIPLIAIGAISFALFVVLWPAMWVHPIGTLRNVITGGRDLAESGADRNIFFRGESTPDPGWLYYPDVLLHRLGAFTVFGLLIAIAAAIRPTDFGLRFPRRLAGYLAGFSVIYVVILSASPKKLDRYVLPAVVSLDLVAAFAWTVAALWIARKLPALSARAARITGVALIIVVLLGQADYAAKFRPFYIDAASPLFGGENGAKGAFSYNWGEGGREVAEALLTIPGIETATVVGGPWEMTIDYYLPFRLNRPEYGNNLRTAEVWMETDYVIVSFPEIQRRHYSPALLAWFAHQTPVREVTTNEGVYARIYDIRGVNPPDSFYSNVPRANWAGIGTVLAARFPESRRVGIDAISTTLILQTNENVGSVPIKIVAQFVGSDKTVAAEATSSPTLTPDAEGHAEASFKFSIPATIAPDRYRIVYTIVNAETGVPISATNEITGEAITDPVLIGTVLIKPPATSQ